MRVDDEIEVQVSPSKTLYIRYKGLTDVMKNGKREVYFEVNGQPRTVVIEDKKAEKTIVRREQAQKGNPKQVGSPMTGAVVDVKVEEGKKINAGDPVCILSAAKMETIVTAPRSGTLKRVIVKKGERLTTGDLLIEISFIVYLNKFIYY